MKNFINGSHKTNGEYKYKEFQDFQKGKNKISKLFSKIEA